MKNRERDKMDEQFKIITGDSLEKLKEIPDGTVNCIVTSPPYFGLRDYGTGEWIGGDPNCPHYRTTKYSENTATGHKAMMDTGNPVGDAIYKSVCPICGAVRVDKQIGLEETPQEYIERLVLVFRECKRALKDDGTLWVNIGDSYNSSQAGNLKGGFQAQNNPGSFAQTYTKHLVDDCKPKDLIGIPWMLAFALRNDGWYLRQDIIWHKTNPMPESVRDRCTKAHEYIFLLSKNPRYYFDHEQMMENAIGETRIRTGSNHGQSKYKDTDQESMMRQGMSRDRGNNIVEKRNHMPSKEMFLEFIKKTRPNILFENTDVPKTTIEHWYRQDSGFSFPTRDDWLKVADYLDDYSETFQRINYGLTEVEYETDDILKNANGKRNKRDVWEVPDHKNLQYKGQQNHSMHERRAEGLSDIQYTRRNKRDVWTVSVASFKEAHFATFPEELIEPCVLAGCPRGGTVLDPFCGSGTTGVVSIRNERNFIGVELNPEYAEMSERRITKEREQGIQMSFGI